MNYSALHADVSLGGVTQYFNKKDRGAKWKQKDSVVTAAVAVTTTVTV